MYENLKAEMARQNKNLVDIANETGLKYQTLREKISGNSHFVLWEIMKIKNALGVDVPLEELFANYKVGKDDESNTD